MYAGDCPRRGPISDQGAIAAYMSRIRYGAEREYTHAAQIPRLLVRLREVEPPTDGSYRDPRARSGMRDENMVAITDSGTTPEPKLKAHWAARRRTFGAWISLPDPTSAFIIATQRFDYIVFDQQHGIIGPDNLAALLGAVRYSSAQPLVRVQWNDPASIMRALDLGATGVIVPLVNRPEDALSAVAACRYPPEGTRSWGPFRAHIDERNVVPDLENRDTVCAIMVETREALENLEDILRVPGIDAVYIGPNDLAMSLGEDRATYKNSRAVSGAIRRISRACRDAGVVAGIHCSSSEMVNDWAMEGLQMLTAIDDVSMLRAACAATLRSIEVGRGL